MTRRAIACEDFGAPCDLLRRKARVLGGGRRAAQQSGGKKTYACRGSGHGEILLDSPGRGHAWSFPPPCGEGRPKRSEGQGGGFRKTTEYVADLRDEHPHPTVASHTAEAEHRRSV